MWSTLEPTTDALFLDIDGTLLDIAAHPQDVTVPEGLKNDLDRLYDRMQGALALISGRSLSNIDELFQPLKLPAAGSHGAEWRLDRGGPIDHGPYLPADLQVKLSAAFKAYPNIYIEDKGYSIAVHYRQAPDLAELVEKTLDDLLSETTEVITLLDGKKVFEVVRPAYNKGRAIERFMNMPSFTNRRPVFLGDDKTDLSAMTTSLRYNGLVAHVGQHEPATGNPFTSPQIVRSWLHQQAIVI